MSIKNKIKGKARNLNINKKQIARGLKDITAKREYLETLKKSNKKITALNRFNKRIIDGISDEVIVIESKTKKIILANQRVIKRTGLSLEKLKKMNCYDIYSTTKKQCSYCILSKSLETRKKEEYEIMLSGSHDNSPIYMNISTHPIFDEDGKITNIVHISRDITAKKEDRKKMTELHEKMLMLFKTSTSLQESLDLDKALATAIHTFKTLGYDRVRIYMLKNDEFIGAKSSHIEEKEFRKIVIPLKNLENRTHLCIKYKRPIVGKVIKTRFTKKLGKTGLVESASLPLLSKGKCMGLISLDNKFTKNPILEENLNILMTFANQIASAIENSIMHKKDIQQLNELRALYDVSSAITSTLNLEKVLNMVVIKIVKLLKADICSILLVDDSGKFLQPYASFDIKNLQHKKEHIVDVNESVSGSALNTNQIKYVSNVMKEKQFKNKNFARRACLKSLLSVPLNIEGIPVGVINIYTRKHREFNKEERELLLGLASHTTIIINNSRLYGRINQDKENFSALVEISQDINSTLNIKDLLEKVLDKTIQFTNADTGFIMLIKDDYFEVKLCREYYKKIIENIKIKVGHGIPGYVAKHKKPEIIGDVRKDAKYIKINDKIMSMAAIPLLYKNEVIGVLDLESEKKDNFKFYKKSLDILTNMIAISIENTQLYDEISKFNIRLKDEINLATHELREKNIELQKLDNLKSDFVSNVSHELRTPLTSISGYTKLMLMQKLGKVNSKQIQSLKIISEESDRLSRLINDVLDLSKLESGKVEVRAEKFDMVELAKETIETLIMTAKEKNIMLALEVKLKKEDNYVYGGRDLIKQVYINLINNALKFTENGGKIIVAVKKNRTCVKISVSDTGKGIPKDYIPKLFNKFVQVDSSMIREHGGTGLGLVIVKHILNLHGGNIEVESEIGKGSTFTFYVPVKFIGNNMIKSVDNNMSKVYDSGILKDIKKAID